MDETFRSNKPFISKTGLFWLTVLVGTNLLIGGFVWAPVAEPARPSPARVPSNLKLISELSEAERESRAQALLIAQRSAGTQSDDASAPLVCRVWGPFDSQARVATLKREIEAVGSALEVQASELAGEPDFLVYVTTDNNSDNARRTLQELESQSVDAYVIAGGPYLNSVSVGVFSRENLAERQRERVQALGYQAVVQPLYRSQEIYHLVARVPAEFSAESARGSDCATIASAG